MARQVVRRKMRWQRMISDDVPGFDAGDNGSDHLKKDRGHRYPVANRQIRNPTAT
jgi:hypothetical protein